MTISLFCILKPNLLFVSPPFVPLSEPRALSAGCLPGREGGGHLAKRQALWIFYEVGVSSEGWVRGEMKWREKGRLVGSNGRVKKKP